MDGPAFLLFGMLQPTGQTFVMIVRFRRRQSGCCRKGRNFVVAQGGFQEITNSRSLENNAGYFCLAALHWTVSPLAVTPIHYVACADRRYRYLQSRHRASKHPWAQGGGLELVVADFQTIRYDSRAQSKKIFLP